MPRFRPLNGSDCIRFVLLDKPEAIREAEEYVRGVMQDAVNGSQTVEHFIEVTDEQGNTVVKLDCKTTIVREGEKPLNR